MQMAFCVECRKKEISSVCDGEEFPSLYCKFCSQNNRKEASIQDGMSPYATPLISPVISTTTFESYGEFSADLNLQRRDHGDGALDTGQGTGHLEDGCNVVKRSDNFTLSFPPMGGIDKSSSITVGNLEDSNSEKAKLSLQDYTSKDVQVTGVDDDSSGVNNVTEKSIRSLTSLMERVELPELFSIETDPHIWQLPEPEDKEDDIGCSVANNDDDDEYTDGTKWVQSSSLGSIDDEFGSSYRFKEERQKAMAEVMNGYFKAVVGQLLRSEGIDFSEEAGESWLDIIVSLSWEAATLVKPDATEGRQMDPGSYVKVKCSASGSRSQSQVIRGLVFKKNAAHKHMPTKYKNPRLLLLPGVLGQRADGLSSFNSMEQEMDYLRTFAEMIEMCKPNVVLVEKNVSRDIQESLLVKEITLVFDMKLPRLERISRCTGSNIVPLDDSSLDPKLKQCDSFHIEKFVEEHNSSGEGGKRQSKTLMFFEGFPKPLGCTILLRGAHSDELKRVKCVVQKAVFLAYHLILETSFLVDQRAIFSTVQTVGIGNGFPTDKESLFVRCASSFNSTMAIVDGYSDGVSSSHTSDITTSNGYQEKSANEGSHHSFDLDSAANSILSVASPHVDSFEGGVRQSASFDNALNNGEIHHLETSHEPLPTPVLPGQLFSSLSASLKRVLGESFPHGPSASYQSISAYFSLKENDQDNQNMGLFSVSPSLEPLDDETEANGGVYKEKSHDGIFDREEAESVPSSPELSVGHCNSDIRKEAQLSDKDEGLNVLDPQCILVYLSSRRGLKGTVCKQHQLFRIKYYGDNDMSLGRFFLRYLLNQQHGCSECLEPPEAHVYSYTHQNGKLTVHVKRLPPGTLLPGEAEGKLWMWTLCLKCEQENGMPKPTRRVVMSSAARGLSLGKFLDLSFSDQAVSSRLSSCGHSLHRDCLHFYGWGSLVAVFSYSSVDIYTACMPPPVLEFSNPNGQDWLYSEAKDVLEKGHLLFMEVMNSLQKIVSRISLSKQPTNLAGSLKELSEIEEMLRQEKSDFEASLHKAINKKGKLGQTVHQILGLNRLSHELLLELYVWDRRLHALGLSTGANNGTQNSVHEEQLQLHEDAAAGRGIENTNTVEYSEKTLEDPIHIASMKNEGSLCFDDCSHIGNLSNVEVEVKPKMAEPSLSEENAARHIQVSYPFSADMVLESADSSSGIHNSIDANAAEKLSVERVLDLSARLCDQAHSLIRDHSQTSEAIPIMARSVSVTDVNQKAETANISASGEASANSSFKESHLSSLPLDLEDSEGWVWTPFSETRKAYRKDLQRGYSQKFEFINNYTPAYLSTVNQLITQEKSRLQFPVDSEDNVVSVYEDEFSSIIACAVALLQDRYSSGENVAERSIRKEKEGEMEKSIESPYGSVSDFSMSYRQWSSGSLDLEGIISSQSVSSDESVSGSDGFFMADTLLSSKSLHPEIPLGVGKLPGKSKYLVVCIFAKQFYALRRRCCPSELDYISSLSRCKKWDAQGGKSGVYFAKTLDDRFIVKQVKKTELDSFLKFGPEYFKHISHSLSSGSQSCLAKILGIYQVIIRQSKSGKEVKIDLMVMENLFFGRNVSRVYDLKGAHHRCASDAKGTKKVLLDQNFVDDMLVSPFYVGGKTKHLLQRAIWNDTSFLTSINVMDYSLLLGVDKQRQEIVFGIIDYLRQYTWDKHLETWVKSSLVVPKNELPTVVSPKEYKKRFRNFMSTHFLAVPDRWGSDPFSGPCKSCRNGSDGSFSTK